MWSRFKGLAPSLGVGNLALGVRLMIEFETMIHFRPGMAIWVEKKPVILLLSTSMILLLLYK